MAPESQGLVPLTWYQHSASTWIPKFLLWLFPKQSTLSWGLCGSFLAQADMDAWGLAVGLPFIQSSPSYNLGSQVPS